MLQNVNLYREDLLPRLPWTRAIVIAALFGCLLLWLAGSAVRAAFALAATQSRAADFERESERLGKAHATEILAPEQRAELESQIENLSARIASLDAQQSLVGAASRDGFHGFFDALEAESDKGVWLHGISIDQSGRNLRMDGRSTSAAAVTLWLRALVARPELDGFRVDEVRISEDTSPRGGAIVQFSARIRE